MTRIKVGDIMTRKFVSVKPDSSLLDAAKEMTKKRVGSLIIKKDQEISGILTEKDIVWAITKKSRKDFKNIKAGDIATKKVKSIKPSANLSQAIKKMKQHGFRWLPVVYKKRVIGMLTLKDILRIQPESVNAASEIWNIKEEAEKLKRLQEKKRWTEGICEECGNFDLIYKQDNRLLCESCVNSM